MQKTVTVDDVLSWGPCWIEEDDGEDEIRAIAGEKMDWSALDILALENVPAKDRLWVVLREELIDAGILHEFACRCAENALSLVNNPDQRSLDAIATKRRWLAGDATDVELAAAEAAAEAAEAAARAAALDAAWAAARASWAAARASWAAARADAEAAARAAALDAAWAAAWAAAWDAAWDAQVKLLVDMLNVVA